MNALRDNIPQKVRVAMANMSDDTILRAPGPATLHSKIEAAGRGHTVNVAKETAAQDRVTTAENERVEAEAESKHLEVERDALAAAFLCGEADERAYDEVCKRIATCQKTIDIRTQARAGLEARVKAAQNVKKSSAHELEGLNDALRDAMEKERYMLAMQATSKP